MNCRRDPDFVPRPAKCVPELLPALGHRERFEVLKHLAVSPACVKEIGDWIGLNPNAVSNALDELYRLGLVEFDREGKFSVYHLTSRVRITPVDERIKIEFFLPDGDEVTLLTKHRPIPGVAPHVRPRSPGSFQTFALAIGATLMAI